MANSASALLLVGLLAAAACEQVKTTSNPEIGARAKERLSSLRITRLRWDASERPVGTLRLEPRLEWLLAASTRGARQTAYQVLVASSEAKLSDQSGDVWNSGKVRSSDSLNVRYGGADLQARQRGYWTVRVWDEDDVASSYAAPVPFEIAPWEEEVEGAWIGRQPQPTAGGVEPASEVTYLRRAFQVPAGFREARLYATAFGLYEPSLNGKRVGEGVLAPGLTDYEKRVLLQTYDVTKLVRPGENVLGFLLAGGWCTTELHGVAGRCGKGPPRLRAALEVTLADGSLRTLESDEHWKYASGPLLTARLLGGESYDARRELLGWDEAGFDDGKWARVVEHDVGIERNVMPDPGVPLVAEDAGAARSVSEPSPGKYVFDLGHEILGWVRLSLTAPAGTRITLRYASRLRADGSLDLAAGAREAVDSYVARGSGTETWEPRFSLRELRYVELTGATSRPEPNAIVGRRVHSALPPAGKLETSSEPLNRLLSSLLAAQRRALVSVASWGEAKLSAPGELLAAQTLGLTPCLTYDVQRFYRKWIDDIRDAQLPSGAYTSLAPAFLADSGGASAGSAGVLVPWALYRCYADRSWLDTHISSMGRFLEGVRADNPNLVWSRGLGAQPGDPSELGRRTAPALLATAELVHIAGALAQMLRHGDAALAPEAQRYLELQASVRAAFMEAFVLPDGRLESDTQTAYAVAIARGALVGAARDRAAEHFVATLERAELRPTTGAVGTPSLLPALSLIGRDDLAYRLLEHFAATEANASGREALAEWMYDAIGGLALDPLAPAGRHVFVRPRPGAGLTSARASHASLYGSIETAWTLDAKTFRLKVTLPVGSRGSLTLPFTGAVTEGGKPVTEAPGVEVKTGGDGTTLAIGSGSYDFAVARP